MVWTVFTFRGAGMYVAPVISFTILGALIVVSFLPRFRAFAVGPTVFALAALAFIGAEMAAMRSTRSWVGDIGIEWLIPLTVFVVAAIAEIAVPSGRGSRDHPASAVVAAAFMMIPPMGTDVTTSYHYSAPSIAAGFLVALAPGAWLASKPVWNQLLRLIEPPIIVLLGWFVAHHFGTGYDAGPRDVAWLLPLFALPASAAAVVGVGKWIGSRW